MSYVAIYSRPAAKSKGGKSALYVVDESNTYEELFFNIRTFDNGIVRIYNTETQERGGRLFPSGHGSLSVEYGG